MSAIVVEKPHLKDFSEIFVLLKQLWRYKTFNKAKMRKIFAKGLDYKHQEYAIARYDTKIIGFAALTIKNSLWDEGNLCYIDVIVVDQKYRRKGVGKKLLDAITKIAHKSLCKRIELDTAFFRKDAHKFYKALGFKDCNLLLSKSI
jgi:GNAT superfamily N-acetyltransferase